MSSQSGQDLFSRSLSLVLGHPSRVFVNRKGKAKQQIKPFFQACRARVPFLEATEMLNDLWRMITRHKCTGCMKNFVAIQVCYKNLFSSLGQDQKTKTLHLLLRQPRSPNRPSPKKPSFKISWLQDLSYIHNGSVVWKTTCDVIQRYQHGFKRICFMFRLDFVSFAYSFVGEGKWLVLIWCVGRQQRRNRPRQVILNTIGRLWKLDPETRLSDSIIPRWQKRFEVQSANIMKSHVNKETLTD